MSIFYDEVVVNSFGILTVKEFPVPRDGRTIKFVMPNGYERKKIYTCIDGKYSGPYSKAEPVPSGIRGFECLKAGTHTASVMVIDTSETVLQPINIEFNPIKIKLTSGENVSVNLSATIRVSIKVKDTDALKDDYSDNGIASAEGRARSVIGECFKSEIKTQIQEYKRYSDNNSGSDLLEQLSNYVKENACVNAEQYLDCPWFEVTACSLELFSSNYAEIIEKENYLWRLAQEEEKTRRENDEKLRMEVYEAKIRMMEMTNQALLANYGRESIPKGMAKLLSEYVIHRPQVQPQELIEICSNFKRLSQTYSMEDLIRNTRKLLESAPNNSGK